ncbi:MAG: hypothetical protein ACREQL_16635 [Candidatus Binatia bacterium]
MGPAAADSRLAAAGSPQRRPARPALLALAATLALACGGAPEHIASTDERASALERVRAFETARREATDFRTLPTSDETMGPDPVAIQALPETHLLVGILRGRSALVLLDDDLHELGRLAAPASPSGLVVSPSGEVFVSGELEPGIARYDLHDGTLRRAGSIGLPGVRSIRALAYGVEGVLYVAEDHDHRLLTVSASSGAILDAGAEPLGLGPRTIVRTPHFVVVDCVLSHEVVVLPVDARGLPLVGQAVRIIQNGPFWSVDARETADGLLLAMGGVEDHPLDRRQGSFGYIDSFAYVYRVAGTPPATERLASVDVSAYGVVTPKVVMLRGDAGHVAVRVVGYGDAPLADLQWAAPRPTRRNVWPRPEVVTRAFVPGNVAAAVLTDGRTAFANPLLDAWIVDDGARARVVSVPDGQNPPRSVDARVGEALFFTTLMAPWNRTKGSLSRFTCETCHFEGYVDGRVHDTGRGDVRVVTKPLLGLFNNRPHFSRALDPDLTAMVHNEFHVAGMRSRHDSWFGIDRVQVPWLEQLGVGSAPLGPEELRRSLTTFFMEFTHRPNPTAIGHAAWSPDERRGAALFRDQCEACHEARLVTDRADSRVPFEAWEELVLSRAGPIVWARDTYERTGVVPYVHERGTRVPSLRRLYKKRPYFTNGSAVDLGAMLRRARVRGGRFAHDGGNDGAPPLLDEPERRALLAFLDLL